MVMPLKKEPYKECFLAGNEVETHVAASYFISLHDSKAELRIYDLDVIIEL